MLCKARNDAIGKKAALSAPEGFLARLLMSSGLPRASLMAMVDRLGKLGDTTEEKDRMYRKLMLPSASSEWDMGRIGKQRDIMQKLVGRLSAYFRICFVDESVSTSFLDWLLKESKAVEEEKPKKPSKKKSYVVPENVTDALRGVAKMFATIKGPLGSKKKQHTTAMGDGTLSEVTFHVARSQEEESTTKGEISALIKSHLSEHTSDGLDGVLGDYASSAGHNTTSSIAGKLIQCVEECPQKQAWMDDALLKWVPLLSKQECNVELKHLLFCMSDKKSATPTKVMVQILRKCILVWTKAAVLECVDWILSIDEQDLSKYSSERMVVFLTTLQDSKLKSLSEKQSKSVCTLALTDMQSSSYSQHSTIQRNDLPDPLRLLLSVAGVGKKHFGLVSDMILQRIFRTTTTTMSDTTIRVGLYGSAYLRLYLLHPLWVNTGTAQVRTVLLKSAEENERHWSCWVSRMDDQFDDLIETLAIGDARVVKVFCEQSRKYPLLVLRKTRAFLTVLGQDASPSSPPEQQQNAGSLSSSLLSAAAAGSPPKVRGNNIGRPVEAMMDDRKITVNIRYWGYEFSEAIWMGVLEIYCGIPKEVLYFSGQELGLWNLWMCVLQLLLVQLHLTSANSVTKIKAKLAEMMNMYRDVNATGYFQWLSNPMEDDVGTTEVRNALVSLNLLSPKDAIESLKNVSKGN